METIDEKTGEVTAIRVPGLWSHFPIRAYQSLGYAGEYKAQRILMCLVSHLGSSGWHVYPSYNTITKLAGVHKNYIRGGLDVLEEFGFNKGWRRGPSEGFRNQYALDPYMYQEEHFNELAKSFLPKPFYCLDCSLPVLRGETGQKPSATRIHYGCGGQVIQMESKERATRRASALKKATCAD